jgi:predicted ferric reductase
MMGNHVVRHRPVVDSASVLFGLGFGITMGFALITEPWSSLNTRGGWVTFLGEMCGLIGGYLLVVMVLLVARVPVIERTMGLDRLTAWHRRLGPWVIVIITFHVWLITLGYSLGARTGFFHEFGSILTTLPDMVMATIGFGLLLIVGATSIEITRRHLRHEWWWVVHCSVYLALVLAFFHQITNGQAFIGHPVARAWWIALWCSAAGSVLVWRIGLPVVRSWRHRLQVVEVIDEAPGVVSIIVAGQQLDRLPLAGGQFFHWRILTRHWWWQAHPYSISALPVGDRMRLTIKSLGDHSAALASIRPGTRLAIEGPYGVFTKHARQRDKAALIGAGVGISPLRSLVTDFPAGSDTVVLLRGRSAAEIPLRAEFADLAADNRIRLIQAIGARADHPLSSAHLLENIPDLTERDVFICGPRDWMHSVTEQLLGAGVARQQIYQEDFA